MHAEVRDAIDGDLAQIAAIYNEVLTTSTAIFSDDSVDETERRDWATKRRQQGYPILVAVNGPTVVGVASYGDFRPQPGYRHAVEHSVHVRGDARSQGVGLQLMHALHARAIAQNKHIMVAAIDALNIRSIRFHQRLGYVEVGRMPQIAVKSTQWLDLVLMQKRLIASVVDG